MITRTPAGGNSRLRAARLAKGYRSQAELARMLNVDVRTVRRWESGNPGWPHPEQCRALTHVLGQDLPDLGFTAPGGHGTPAAGARRPASSAGAGRLSVVAVRQSTLTQPPSAAVDFLDVTSAHRHLYWSVAPDKLCPAVIAHANLGSVLLPETTGKTRKKLAGALAETYLLAGRITFFDLREPEKAGQTMLLALQMAAEADDQVLGAAVLAHLALVPGWEGQHEAAMERMQAARSFARRGRPSPLFLAWLDTVEAECQTRCGNTRTALHLIGQAEDALIQEPAHPSPDWLDWFSPAALAAVKGNTQLKAGLLSQARQTLLGVLERTPRSDGRQRTVVLGDLAGVEAADGRPDRACAHALQALEQLEVAWYGAGMDRVRDARRTLAPHRHEPCVRDLDDRLYGWGPTVSALVR